MRFSRLTAIATLAAIPACDDATSVDEFRLSGIVRLVGYERDATGLESATRQVDDATGVRITLTRDGTEIRTTTTTNGAFAFDGLGTGAYRVGVGDLPGTRSNTIDIDLQRDLALTEPIVVEGSGNLVMYPNPFSWPETAAHFLVPVPRHVRLTLEDATQVVVRTLVDEHISEGFHDLWWDGLDDDGQPVPAGEYWAVLEIAGDVAADLAFLDAPVPVPEDPLFAWTISGSATDPFANTTADHSGAGIMSLYLWLVCNTREGFSQGQFDVVGTYEVLATNYRNGFISAGGATSLLLSFSCQGEPLSGPVVAAEFLVLEGTGTGNLCLAPSSLTGRNASLDCFHPEWVPNTYLGFSDDGSAPCLETGGAEELCP